MKKRDLLWILCFISITGLILFLPLSRAVKRASADISKSEQQLIDGSDLAGSVVARPDGRGKPWINLSEGRSISTAFVGNAKSRLFQSEGNELLLKRTDAMPQALSSGDFDEDGVPDLVASYSGTEGGTVVLYRGNIDSIYPNSPAARARKAAGTFTESPFLSPARVFEISAKPEMIGVGDFDADGHLDIVSAAKSSDKLQIMSGDGKGGLKSPISIGLPDRATALIVGDLNRRDGLADITVGIEGRNGSQVLIYESPAGAVRAIPEAFSLPAKASSFALGQFDESFETDLAVGAGKSLIIIHGRDRRLSFPERMRLNSVAKVESIKAPFEIISIAAGDFGGSRKQAISMLSHDGSIATANRNGKNWSLGETIKVSESGSAQSSFALASARLSSKPYETLLSINSAGKKIDILAENRSASSIAVESEPVAVLPMRLNQDAIADLVILQSASIQPSAIVSQAAMTFTVTNTGVGGTGSLSQAITDANGNAGADTIVFNISTGGPQTITPSGNLPVITEAVTIDGTTQGGFAGSPLIELNGANAATSGGIGFFILGGSSTVRGMVINRFSQDGIRLSTSGGNIIEGNYLGTDAGGSSDLGNGAGGVAIDSISTANTIGGTTAAARNIISGNDQDGVLISGSTGNMVMGNFIGTDRNGVSKIPNSSNGVFVQGGSTNTIGGTGGAGNVLTGNGNSGVLLAGNANQLFGNLIGLYPGGGTDTGNTFEGVEVQGSSNSIGGFSGGAGNFISNNTNSGLSLTSTNSIANLVQGNQIGIDPSGGSQPNTGAGVLIAGGASNNLIGTVPLALNRQIRPAQVTPAPSPSGGNTIAFNLNGGVAVGGGGLTPGVDNEIRSNSIFSNGGLGIDLGSDGVTANDGLGDADNGANNLQNYPVLTSATTTTGGTTVVGTLQSAPLVNYTLEFFANTTCDTSSFGEGEMFLGSTVVTTDTTGGVNFNAPLTAIAPTGTTVTATATDPSGNTSEFSQCIAVTGDGTGCPTISVFGELSSGVTQQPYEGSISAEGGMAPYTFARIAGALPTGLAILGNGTITGIPTQPGIFNFTIQATDAAGCQGMADFQISISGCPTFFVSPAMLPNGVVGTPYKAQFGASGGSPPYFFNLLGGKRESISPQQTQGGGSLPDGLMLSDGGLISGTPTKVGSFTFSFRVSDSSECSTDFTYTLTIALTPPKPTISIIDPLSGPPGTSVMIVGSNFTGATAVNFNGIAASAFTVFTSTTIRATVPAGATTGPITVITPSGTVASASVFTVIIQPVIGGFSPPNSRTGGTVTISGSGFTAATAVMFNNVTADFTVNSDTSITAVVPQQATTGRITVVNASGMALSTANFTVQPNVTTFTPFTGTPGTTVTISGSGLNDATAVRFNGVDASNFDLITQNSIRAVVPLTATSGPITIITPSGSTASSVPFTVKPAVSPGILSFSAVNFSATEASGAAAITVSRTGGTSGAVSATIALTDGTATAGADYTAATGTVVFADGDSSSKTFSIAILSDNLVEGNETVNLALVNLTGGAIAGPVMTATLTIIDSLGAPVLQTLPSVDFGTANIGDVVTRLIPITNGGRDILNFSAPVVATGGNLGFTVLPLQTLSLMPGQSTNFIARFQPNAVNLNTTGTIVITSNGGNATIALLAAAVENTAPTVAIQSPAGGENILSGSPFIIQFIANDNDALTSISADFSIDGGASFQSIGIVSAPAATIMWNVPDGLQTNAGRIRVTARDRSGNLGSSLSNSFNIGRQPQPAPSLNVVLTFNPPPQGQIAPPQNLRAQASENRGSINAGLSLLDYSAKTEKIGPSIDDPTLPIGFNIYRVPAPPPGQPAPTPAQIVNNPNNLVGSVPGNMTSFTDMVSTGQGNNFVYSATSFFGNGQQSGGSNTANTNLPVINNPNFLQGTIFIDAAGSFIAPTGAMLLINDSESFTLVPDSSGSRFTVSKKTIGSAGRKIKKAIRKGATVRLTVKNPDGSISVGVMFTRPN